MCEFYWAIAYCALCLFDITLLSTPPNYVAGMQFEAQLHLGIDHTVLCSLFQSCVHCSSPMCMYLASTLRLSYFYVILVLSFIDFVFSHPERSEELLSTAPSHSEAGGPFSAKPC